MSADSHYQNAWAWEKAIRDESRTAITRLKGLAAFLVLIFLGLATLLNLAFPANAQTLTLPLGVDLSRNAATRIGAAAGIVALLFSTGILDPLSKWYEPDRRRYRAAAVHTIESLKNSAAIDAAKEAALKDIAQRLLGAVEGKTPAANPREMLLRAAYELAEKMR